MRYAAIFALAISSVSVVAVAQEGRIVLSAPDQATAGAAHYDVDQIRILRGNWRVADTDPQTEAPCPNASIYVELSDGTYARGLEWSDTTESDGSCVTTATTVINALNTANLSTRSLRRRILDRAVTDGKLTGTVQ